MRWVIIMLPFFILRKEKACLPVNIAPTLRACSIRQTAIPVSYTHLDVYKRQLYNYYPTKDSLVLDVVQQFWQNCFQQKSFPEGDVLVKLDWLYAVMKESVDEFSSEFLHAASGLSPAALEEAKSRELHAQKHLTHQLALALKTSFPDETDDQLDERAAFLFYSLLGCLENRGYRYESLRRWLESVLTPLNNDEIQ